MQEHGKKLGVKVIAQGYGTDPSAVARDAMEYATKHGIQVTLIDTAGRMNNSKPLMNELNKVVRVTKPDMKIFICDAFTGNDVIDQAKIFYNHTEFDGVIMTKMDPPLYLAVRLVSGPLQFLLLLYKKSEKILFLST